MKSKETIRKEIRDRKRHFNSDELREMSLPVVSALLENEHVLSAHTVMAYCSLSDEVDTRQLLNRLVAMGKRVLLPKVTNSTRMELREYHGEADLISGAYGIMEPDGPTFTDYAAIDAAIVPGMSFDKDGNRLGRGKGYYDRFLTLLPHAYLIGVCFGFQLSDEVPHTDYDIRMNEVIY